MLVQKKSVSEQEHKALIVRQVLQKYQRNQTVEKEVGDEERAFITPFLELDNQAKLFEQINREQTEEPTLNQSVAENPQPSAQLPQHLAPQKN